MTDKEFIAEVEKLGLKAIMADAGNFLEIYDVDQLMGKISLLREKIMFYNSALRTKAYGVKLLNLMYEYALTPIEERSNKMYKIKIKGEWVCDVGDCILMLDKEDLATAYKGHEIELIEVKDD